MIRKLLVPLDGSGFGEETLPYAARIARSAGTPIDVAHVHVPHPPDHLLSNTQYQYEGVDMLEYDHQDREAETLYLGSMADRLARASGQEAHPVLLEGLVTESLTDYLKGEEPGLIVMSTHGRTGLSRAWLGSVADAMVRNASWPVLLVRPVESRNGNGTAQAEPSLETVLVPLDGSSRSERILEPAEEMARHLGARIRLLQIVPASRLQGTRILPVAVSEVNESKRRAREYLEGLAESLGRRGVEVSVMVEDDPQPALAILEVAEREEFDLIAMATRGRSGVRRAVLGSVADKVVRGAEIPVLLLGPGADT
jgi:nucleotide-binding universal stress UspA family protein